MREKRTTVDFSKHELIITKESENTTVYHLKKPDTITNNIMYINTNGILAIRGDFGNWILCREFHPGEDGYVSDGYWMEKLSILSTQEFMEYDSEATEKGIHEKIADLDYYTSDEKKKEQLREYFEECLDRIDDKYDYEYYAHREKPHFMDYEDVVMEKIPHRWLSVIFDGFDEMCNRLKEKELNG